MKDGNNLFTYWIYCWWNYWCRYFVFCFKIISRFRNSYNELNNSYIKSISDLENINLKNQELTQSINKEKELNQQQSDLLSDLKNEFVKISAEYSALNSQSQEQKQINTKQVSQIENLIAEKQTLFAKNSELSAINESLQKSLETQKRRDNQNTGRSKASI